MIDPKQELVFRSFIIDMTNEYKRSRQTFPQFASHHEAYAVIQEELDEYWDEVKQRPHKRREEKMKHELKQVATMCIAAIVELIIPDDTNTIARFERDERRTNVLREQFEKLRTIAASEAKKPAAHDDEYDATIDEPLDIEPDAIEARH